MGTLSRLAAAVTFALLNTGCVSLASIYREDVLAYARVLEKMQPAPWMTPAAMRIAARECPTTRLGTLTKLVWKRCQRTVTITATLGSIASKLERVAARPNLLPSVETLRRQALTRAELNGQEWAVGVGYEPEAMEGSENYSDSDARELVEEIAASLGVDALLGRLGLVLLKHASADGRVSARAAALDTNVMINLALAPRWTLPIYRQAVSTADIASIRSVMDYRFSGARAAQAKPPSPNAQEPQPSVDPAPAPAEPVSVAR